MDKVLKTKNKKQFKNNKGITLVALIITVILMLILAGVAISAVIDSEGLFSKSREATKTYENSAKDENKTISNLMNYLEIYLHEVENEKDVEDEPVDENPVVKTPATIGTLVTENQTFDGRLKGTYNNPIIPKGFAAINQNDAIWGTETGYQKGLVITDDPTMNETTGVSQGNEFVWVPVPGDADGSNITFGRQNWYGADGVTVLGRVMGIENEETSIGIDTITENVEAQKGFYIARYEAGYVNNQTVSKQGVSPKTYVLYENAKNYAESMYPESDAIHNVISKLIYGAHWDTTLNFIVTENYNGDELYSNYITSGGGYGNYSGTYDSFTSTTSSSVCGATASDSNAETDAFRQRNIYDLAGNVWEWTMEIDENKSKRILRGGAFNSNTNCSAANRLSGWTTPSNSDIGFRVILCIE